MEYYYLLFSPYPQLNKSFILFKIYVLQLKLPYHIVSIVFGALNNAAAKKYGFLLPKLQRIGVVFKLH